MGLFQTDKTTADENFWFLYRENKKDCSNLSVVGKHLGCKIANKQKQFQERLL